MEILTVILLILMVIGIPYYLIFYPVQKIKKIKNNLILKVNGADTRYSNLPLGNLGILYEINEKRKVRVIFPKLTPEGDVKYIYSWHTLQSISIPNIGTMNIQEKSKFIVVQELAFLMKDHIRFVEPEVVNLKKQWNKIKELLDLVSTSNFYASQKGIYEKALVQVENLLDKAEELEQVYINFIREVLIGRKVAGFDPNLLPDGSLSIDNDNQYKRIKEEYQYMKDTATAYAELIRTRQV